MPSSPHRTAGEKDKDSVSYNIVWGTGALAILMLLPAVMTIIKG